MLTLQERKNFISRVQEAIDYEVNGLYSVYVELSPDDKVRIKARSQVPQAMLERIRETVKHHWKIAKSSQEEQEKMLQLLKEQRLIIENSKKQEEEEKTRAKREIIQRKKELAKRLSHPWCQIELDGDGKVVPPYLAQNKPRDELVRYCVQRKWMREDSALMDEFRDSPFPFFLSLLDYNWPYLYPPNRKKTVNNLIRQSLEVMRKSEPFILGNKKQEQRYPIYEYDTEHFLTCDKKNNVFYIKRKDAGDDNWIRVKKWAIGKEDSTSKTLDFQIQASKTKSITIRVTLERIAKIMAEGRAVQRLLQSTLFNEKIELWRHSLWIPPNGAMVKRAYERGTCAPPSTPWLREGYALER